MQASRSKTQGLIERRRALRVPLPTPHRWEFRLRNGSVDAVVSDLSEDGMFVNAANSRVEGSEVDFEVQFAGMQMIKGRGEVAWVCDRSSQPHHARGIGIRFLDLKGDSQEVVRLRVTQRLRSHGGLAAISAGW